MFKSYLVGLVIILRIELHRLGLLGVVEGLDQLVGAEFFAPFLIVDEPVCISTGSVHPGSLLHQLGSLDVEFAGAQETEQGEGVEALGIALGLQHTS
jgi:hypothetical protein